MVEQPELRPQVFEAEVVAALLPLVQQEMQAETVVMEPHLLLAALPSPMREVVEAEMKAGLLDQEEPEAVEPGQLVLLRELPAQRTPEAAEAVDQLMILPAEVRVALAS